MDVASMIVGRECLEDHKIYHFLGTREEFLQKEDTIYHF